MADASAGTPLWLTLVLQGLTLWGTHLLAKRREAAKQSGDVLREWKKDQTALLVDCVDAAVMHYADASRIPGTDASATLILGKLRRLSIDQAKYETVDGRGRADAMRLFRELHAHITDAPDFRQIDRAARPPDDELLTKIRDCQADMLRNFAKERRV